MLIVLEGMDGSGKTTLATLLSKLMNAEVIHATRETPNNWKWFSKILDESKTRNIIADRFFWGQFVYQEETERHITVSQLHELENRLYKEGGHLIYVNAYWQDIMERTQSRGEQLSLPFKVLCSRYTMRMVQANCPVIKYNTSTGEVS